MPREESMANTTIRMVVIGPDELRQIVREEMDAAIERYHQHGLDRLLAAVDAEPEPEDNVVAVLATMTAEEWETLVQRVRERKAHE